MCYDRHTFLINISHLYFEGFRVQALCQTSKNVGRNLCNIFYKAVPAFFWTNEGKSQKKSDILRVFSCNPGSKHIKLTQKFLGFLQYFQTNDKIVSCALLYISICYSLIGHQT